MANWSVTDNTYSAVVDTAESAQVVTLTISPVVDGVHSGAYIRKQNFKIGDATHGPDPGTDISADAYNTWTGGNVDTPVSKVVFTDIGTPGEIDNTVLATVHLSDHTPANGNPIYVDIDETDVTPAFTSSLPVCFETTFNYHAAGETITYSDVTTNHGTAVTKTTLSNGTEDPKVKHETTVLLGVKELVATITFTAADGYYYKLASTQDIGILVSGMEVFVIGDLDLTLDDAGRTTGFVVSYYTDIPQLGIEVFGGAISCEEGVNLHFSQVLDVIQVPVDATINAVTALQSLPFNGGVFPITVQGAAGSSYLINLDKKNSLTSIVDAVGIDVNYNFSDGEFTAYGPTGGMGNGWAEEIADNSVTLDSTLKHVHYFSVGETTTSRRFDVTLQGLVNNEPTVIGNGAPGKAGEFSIIQYGLDTVSIVPYTLNSARYDTLPAAITISRPTRYPGDAYSGGSEPNPIFAQVLDTSHSAVNRLGIALSSNDSVIVGMLVTGDGVEHDTTVSYWSDSGYIELSKPCTRVVNGSRIRFDRYTTAITPFSFVINPASGKQLELNDHKEFVPLGSAPMLVGGVGGATQRRKIGIAGVAGTTATLAVDPTGLYTEQYAVLTGLPSLTTHHGTRGIVPGMVVKVPINTNDSELLTRAAGFDFSLEDTNQVTVASVTNESVIELSSSQSEIYSNHLDFEALNPEVSLISIEAVKEGNSINISGYIYVVSIDKTGTAPIYLDSIISTTTIHG